MEDASRSEAEIEKSLQVFSLKTCQSPQVFSWNFDGFFLCLYDGELVHLDTRLNNRLLDFRTPANQASPALSAESKM